MKPIRGFLLSTAFIGLAWLAFNPHFVVKIQNGFKSEEEVITPEIEDPSHIAAEQPSDVIQNPKAEVPETTIRELKNIEPEINEDDIIKPTAPNIIKAEPPQLPFTVMPDEDNLPVIDNFDELAVNDL